MKIFIHPSTCLICGGPCMGMGAGWWQVHIDPKVCIANLKDKVADLKKKLPEQEGK